MVFKTWKIQYRAIWLRICVPCSNKDCIILCCLMLILCYGYDLLTKPKLNKICANVLRQRRIHLMFLNNYIIPLDFFARNGNFNCISFFPEWLRDLPSFFLAPVSNRTVSPESQNRSMFSYNYRYSSYSKAFPFEIPFLIHSHLPARLSACFNLRFSSWDISDFTYLESTRAWQ